MPIDPVPDMALALLNCLKTAVSGSGGAVSGSSGIPQNFCFRIGEEITQDVDLFTDLCCEGLGYVSLGDIYPSSDSFPEQDVVRQADQICIFPTWAVGFRMGIIRCIPTGTDTEMPTCSEWNAAALRHMADAGALRRAACCFRTLWQNQQPGYSVVIGPNSATTPQGGCAERFVTIIVQMINCDC